MRFIDSSDVVNAWMSSPTHRANIVKPVYTEIGVGVAQGLYQGQESTYVVQYFGTSLRGVSVVAASTPPPAVSIASQSVAIPSVPAQIEGASVAAAPISQSSSFIQSFVRQLIHTLAEPNNVSNWILGFAAAVLIVALCMTFFMHVQIQSTNMIVSGVLVTVLALSFLALNLHLSEGGLSLTQTQSASVADSSQGVTTLDPGAASTGYALFPSL